jgi:hypothetical protein
MGIRFVIRIASYNALFDTEKSVIEGKIDLFWDENCFKLMGWLGPTPIQLCGKITFGYSIAL